MNKNRVLTLDEENRLLDACPNHLRPVVVAAIDTGMRFGELAALQWRDVDLEQQVIRIQDSKTTNERQILIPVRLSEVLTALYRESPCGPRGRPLQRGRVFAMPQNIRRAFSDARVAARLPDVRFYDLRLTHVQRLARESGVVN